MKKIHQYIGIAVVALASLTAASCSSDDTMTDINTDPSKAATMDPNAQLTTAELQTYGDLGMVEIYRNYHYAFDQQLMGCWNTTNYGGHHTIDNNEMSRVWTSLYPTAVKNIVDAIAHADSKPNLKAVASVYRVYLMSLITDIYGDCPYTEAGLGFIKGISNAKYDEQKDIYYDFFNQLDSADRELNAANDKVTGDVIYNGDVAKWKKLANSLRLRYAMRISNVEPDKARQEFEKALIADGGIIESADDDAYIHYMTTSMSFGQESYSDYRGNRLSQLLFGNDPANNPSYICSTFFNKLKDTGDPRTYRICRFYYDGLMSATGPDNRIDLTDEMISQHQKMEPCDPGAYSWDAWPTGYTSDLLTEMAKTNSKINPSLAREVRPKLANNFLKTDNPGIIMTSAEVDFLLAEATLKGWNVGRGSVDDLYWQGVRKAMDLLSDRYDCKPVSDEEFNTYKANNSIGHTNDQKDEAINTQAWILHFTNPAECWANVRRSGYPKLLSPDAYGWGSMLTGGKDIPVRLCYPVLESSYNKANYDEALGRMGGKNDWHTPLWWDQKQ
ncbi:SusD/RagB family nutrient-binding outer membrane lipoprotein [Prevotella lacticifex]|uniref:SusD/RagB family nutrient-binding outer membrane lipoprotein n=2 Tax=Prevotella TaxID=838 RepID=A0A9R1CC66_9BACT|nr:SusD/RagB family nutrient-binding outer membrane lipoprotein [Prevotella lacticifex]GJG36454.1 hypothetical protein PRLR5003_16110 [Prevotella lacticifex]GJG38313.1 hypothetical protein PRLR5019_02840 [Prevotella lacticifex]GJG43004.1 hypothetical protein PRLR5025_17900 [Prevotella lacticifex]GJG44670.1 hypothetical protein PRLR5027_02650 [Prevotella lacticifex]GJG49355.1 hypothetical protein PRLR5052_17680 [Prevotella lacticifex]